MLQKKLRNAALAAAIALALSGTALSSGPAAAAVTETVTPIVQKQGQLPDFVSLVERCGKAVVNISTLREARTVELPDGMDEKQAEIFKRFGFPFFPFGGGFGPRQEPERRGNGSGFIISPDGLILTNHHVVEGVDEITVRLTDNREFKGKVLGTDAKTDIAVVKIEAKNLPVVKLGSSDALKVGEWVAAIGSPFGLDNTVTAGIVSAVSRKLPSDQYVPFIQTDVAVNPGNSGGPLFNMNGEVVGINSQIFSTSGGFMGLSFAIPIDLALQIKDQLVKHGKVTRGWVGVVIQSVTQDLADSFGLKEPKGAIIAQVQKGGPASKAGLQEGDVIVGVNGKDVTSSSELPVIIGSMAPGDIARMKIIRDGKPITIDVTIEEADQDSAGPGKKSSSSSAAKMGVSVRGLTDEEKEQFGLDSGLLVTKSDGAARKAGIRQGDVIISVNGQKMAKIADLNRAADKGNTLRVLVQRQGSRIFIPVRLK